MSEDRTQPPSKRRRQLAREQGQAAHSPELTAACGWLAGVIVLGWKGGDLAGSLISLMQRSAVGSPTPVVDVAGLVADLRGTMARMIVPMALVVGGFWLGALAAHQLQVRGLWAVSLIAPDPARLWSLGRVSMLSASLERIGWAVIKAVVLVSVSLCMLRAQWVELQRLSARDFPAVAGAAGQALLQTALLLAIVLLIMGVADYALRYLRCEAMLRTTPQEQREDQRVMEGDLASRSKRRRIARSWRGDAPELLAGASLIVIGTGGLTVVLVGGPPPRQVSVRTVAQGSTGLQLRRWSSATRLPIVEAHELALILARLAASGSASHPAIPAEVAVELASNWLRKD